MNPHYANQKARPGEVVGLYAFLISQAVVFLVVLYLAVASILNLFVPTKWPLPQTYWIVFCVGYVVMIFGVSLWLHRMATHQSYKAPLWFRYTIGALGAMAVQGYVRNWVGDHWEHHEHTDVPCKGQTGSCDPHTPREYDHSRFKGFVHSGWAWLIKPGQRPEPEKWANLELQIEKAGKLVAEGIDGAKKAVEVYEDQMLNRRVSRYFDRTFALWVMLSVLVPGLICWVLEGTLLSFIIGVVICGFGRVAAVNVATSLVNSYEHIPGLPGNYRHAAAKDDSQNNWLIALFNPEGFHANHHLFQRAANQGILWYERILDHSANILWVLEKFGVVWDVQWVTKKDLEEKKKSIEEANRRAKLQVQHA